MTAYFISGLGADSRIFHNLRLPSTISIKHINWEEPFIGESLHQYCDRLIDQVHDTEDIILVGLSFGGLIAVELNKKLNARLVILLSTISTKEEIPFIFRLINKMKLYKIVPPSFYKRLTPVVNWYFGAKTHEEKELVQSFLEKTSDNYLTWSIDKILNWGNTDRPSNVFHIHGTADKIFPKKSTRADEWVKAGDHLMVYDMSGEVSKLINGKLDSIST